jgi:hypothetical protein
MARGSKTSKKTAARKVKKAAKGCNVEMGKTLSSKFISILCSFFTIFSLFCLIEVCFVL